MKERGITIERGICKSEKTEEQVVIIKVKNAKSCAHLLAGNKQKIKAKVWKQKYDWQLLEQYNLNIFWNNVREIYKKKCENSFKVQIAKQIKYCIAVIIHKIYDKKL